MSIASEHHSPFDAEKNETENGVNLNVNKG